MKKCGYCKGTGRKLKGKVQNDVWTGATEKCTKCNGSGVKSK
ncbi:MAG: hypothetical protein RBT15_04820 [Gudongella sp.]|jgi:DnaJ-class molecular chaperone|nr:hypothetical protein [Gudongella sp.]